jgi:hypothetical protein
LAGSVFPFPVIYTGGVNPLLWRPLTGILSFDIPPYRFDLTPFAGLFNNGQTHNITITISGDNKQGFWYLDGAFVLYNDQPGARIEGHLIQHVDAKPQVNVAASSKGGFLSLYTTGEHDFFLLGMVISRWENGSTTTMASVHGSLTYENFNTISLDGSIQETHGTLDAVITSEVQQETAGKRVSRFRYPFDVYQEGTEKDNLLQIKANVQYSREREEQWFPFAGGFFEISWTNAIGSSAFYNRSADALEVSEVVYNETNASVETYTVTSPFVGLCYNRNANAANGTILLDTGRYNCSFPEGIIFCGFELCPYSYKY